MVSALRARADPELQCLDGALPLGVAHVTFDTWGLGCSRVNIRKRSTTRFRLPLDVELRGESFLRLMASSHTLCKAELKTAVIRPRGPSACLLRGASYVHDRERTLPFYRERPR
jgi:hypothetical protein